MNLFAAAIATSLISLNAFAAPINIGSGKVHFLAVGRPAMIKINGESQILTGSFDTGADNKASGQFDFDLTTLTTGIDTRDRHMKEKYLETEKFKTATLKFKEIEAPTGEKESNQTVKALLNLHGVEKPVDVVAKIKHVGSGYLGEGTFKIMLSDYNVQIPSYAGIKVADQVEVTVNFQSK